MKKLLISIFVFYLAIWNVTSVYAANQDNSNEQEQIGSLYAKAAVLMDADSGRVLYGKNADEQLPMASTTKIMTLIVTLENTNIDDIVTVSKYASSMPDVQLNALAGEQFYLRDLLYSLMLESHNDSAAAIAEYVGSTAFSENTDPKDTTKDQSKEYIKAFAKMMNQKASDIGCYNTYFITPNGLDAQVDMEDGSIKVHSTTARDLARIMSYCIKESPQKDLFLEITRTGNYSFHNMVEKEDGTVESGSRSFSCNNHNAFLNMMDGALSGKTGFTNNAGYCYVGALERDGKTFVVALLACGWPNNKSYKWSDTKKLMSYGLDNYSYRSFDEAVLDESNFEPIVVRDGQTAYLGEKAYSGVRVLDTTSGKTDQEGILLREDEKIEVKYDIRKVLEAPANVGDIVGTVQYLLNGEVWKVKNVVLTDSVKRIDFTWCLQQVFRKFSI